MRADLTLKQRQGFWETPRNLVIVIGTVVAATAAIAGVLGFQLGQRSPPIQTIVIQMPAPPIPQSTSP